MKPGNTHRYLERSAALVGDSTADDLFVGLDALPLGVAVVAFETEEFLFVNRALFEMCRMEPTNPQRLKFTDFLSDYQPWQASHRVGEARRSGHYEFDRVLRRPDGTSFVANVKVTPFPAAGSTAIMCTVRDLSREEISSGNLRGLIDALAHLDGPDFFQRLVRQLSVSIGMKHVGVCRLHDGDVVETVAFWSEGKLVPNISYGLAGTPCRHVFDRCECVVIRGAVEKFPDDDDLAVLNAEAYLGVQLRGPDGTPLGHLFGVHDEPLVTHESALEVLRTYAPLVASQMNRLILSERTEDMEQQLLQSLKLESLGVLAGGVAHDFNNLLAAIQGNAELAAPQTESDEVRNHLNVIRSSTHRAAGLCRQLLAYAGRARFHLEEFDLEALIQESIPALEASLPRDVTMSLALDPERHRVRADRAQLLEIVTNLIANAIDAMVGHAGAIMVRTGSVDCDEEYLSASLFAESSRPGRFSFVEVSDCGKGMSAEVVANMFDPFYSTKGGGRGLGLSTVLGMVKSHGGALRVNTSPAKGTTVKVLLPELQQLETVDENHARSGALAGRCVLLADDESAVRQITRTFLTRAGAQVIVTKDGAEALSTYLAQSAEIDLVLLDLSMPNMTGEEAFLAIREQNPDAKVVLMTGHDARRMSDRLLESGLDGFLHKPFTSADLVGELERLIGLLES